MTDIVPIRSADYVEVLPLIAAYQRFYEVEPDAARNEDFFRRFVDHDAEGTLLGARDGNGALIGYACLHWRLDSVAAREVVCLHDLYVAPEHRSTGAGRALLAASAEVARQRGASALVWSTAPDNMTAQRLYDSAGAIRSSWFEYDLSV